MDFIATLNFDMVIQNIAGRLIFSYGLFMLLICLPSLGETASVRTRIDAKFIQKDTTKNQRRTLDNEYNPRITVQYSHPLTEWTDLSAETKFDYKKEDKRPDPDSETREPQLELRLKSLIYDFKSGFKETWNNHQSEQRAFGHLLLQPHEISEFLFDYDHDEKEDQYKKDKITLGTLYKPSSTFRVKLDFKHEYTDNLDQTGIHDQEDYDLSGEVKFNHTLSSRRPIKVEVSYKAESLYQEEKDAAGTPTEDQLLQTLRGKLTYKPTTQTDISMEYESKAKNDEKGNQDNSDQDMQLDVSQKLAEWLTATARIRQETKEERTGTDGADSASIKDTDKQTLQGQVRAIPTDWFQLTVKAIDENLEETDPNAGTMRKDKNVLQGSLRSDFPNLLHSNQTLDYEKLIEDQAESPFSREERFIWKWSLSPLENLSISPQHGRSVTRSIKDHKRDTTKEYKIDVGYTMSIHDKLSLDFSHLTSSKQIETVYADRKAPDNRRELSDDTSLEVDYQPVNSLFITSQITRKNYKIGGGEKPREEMSYSIKFDWSLSPFTWSTSYKYDDKKQENDTETFESKLIYDYSDYTIEGEYKYTQTFMPLEDREDTVTLRLKAVF